MVAIAGLEVSRRRALEMLALPLLVSVGTLRAEPPVDTSAALNAVNLAGRARMLSQRTTKAYLLVGQQVDAARAATVLTASIVQFDADLATLEGLSADPQISAARAVLARAWRDMKPLLEAAPDAAGAQALYDASETVQKAAHELTALCERHAPAPLAHLVNLAGRQRMLSQRMAKFFLYRTWDISADAADMELELAHAHFNAVLIQLEKSALVDGATRGEIVALRAAWQDYEPSLIARGSVVYMRAKRAAVAKASEVTLEHAERVVSAIISAAAPR